MGLNAFAPFFALPAFFAFAAFFAFSGLLGFTALPQPACALAFLGFQPWYRRLQLVFFALQPLPGTCSNSCAIKRDSSRVYALSAIFPE